MTPEREGSLRTQKVFLTLIMLFVLYATPKMSPMPNHPRMTLDQNHNILSSLVCYKEEEPPGKVHQEANKVEEEYKSKSSNLSWAEVRKFSLLPFPVIIFSYLLFFIFSASIHLCIYPFWIQEFYNVAHSITNNYIHICTYILYTYAWCKVSIIIIHYNISLMVWLVVAVKPSEKNTRWQGKA